jgi:two-component system chemotaxis response regulator CheY
MHKILIVDDAEASRIDLRSTLEKANFEVVDAIHGLDGFNKATLKGDSDLIITDYNMPEIDGLAMIERLRGHALTKTVPIIVLTSDSIESIRPRAKELNISAVVIKPFDPASLVKAVNLLIEKSKKK